MSDLLPHDFWSWTLDKGTVSAAKAVTKSAITGAIAGGAFLLTSALRKRGAVVIERESGRTVQSPQVLVTGFACGLVSLGVLVWGIVDPETLAEPGAGIAWMLLISGFTLGFVALSIYAAHRWSWDDAGLQWDGAFRRVRIAWPDLVSAGHSWDGQFVAKDRAGRKVRWTNFALEHQAIMEIANAHLARNQAGAAQPHAA